ncbi:MAG: Glycine/sarcosine/betaine reductase complex component C subunit beta [candidate division WS2 bacterium]|nr:Glycine/sarcosine/betaine reductase complex component C subunit beta [Candidatus Psychracetigena formicireducens]
MKPVVKGVALSLFHVPTLMAYYGNVPYYERVFKPDSEYLSKLSSTLRTYDEAVKYPPNQVFIGNYSPEELRKIKRPWLINENLTANREGEFGEIFNELEFFGWLKIADSFELVWLEKNFLVQVKEIISRHSLFYQSDLKDLGEGKELYEIKAELAKGGAVPLFYGLEIIGCVRNGHAYDENLKGYPLLEKLANKASSVVVLRQVISNCAMEAKSIDFIIESSEEAVGDMFQPGGGDLAKAIAEKAQCLNANGVDVRAFCAGPAGAVIIASSLVKSGLFKNVVVIGGGSVPKLGMNSREHVAKGLTPLEDCLGAVAVLISEDDGISPVINLDSVGRHKVGTGSSPQAITTALVSDPLKMLGLNFTDVDKYAPELHNPEITEPAGAGDVPLANIKMIAALATMQGEIKRDQMDRFIVEKGIVGFSPTQGHIPSGVPILGWARKEILIDNWKRVMVIGKGSLFLARMTNLAEGFSFLVEKNEPVTELTQPTTLSREYIREVIIEVLQEMSGKFGG